MNPTHLWILIATGLAAAPGLRAAETATATSTNAPAGHEAPGETDEDLAKAAQNPVAKLISIPFQNNFNFGVGPNSVCQYILNFQPVIPITLNEDWNLITRTIVPIINQPSPGPGIPNASGLGDINPTFFLSPASSGGLIWGVGPTFTFPTATDGILGSSEWMAGPAVVALTMQKQWVIGALMNNQWSFAGWGSSQNRFLTQPFINYNFPGAWYLTFSPIITADWNADSAHRWVVPVGGGLGKIVRLGKLPLNLQLDAYYNVVTPATYGADWQLRFQFQFLLPKSIL
ncbi:MAG: neuromedin U [Verrucomicrobiota bacterium]